jgi:hypothetical protein
MMGFLMMRYRWIIGAGIVFAGVGLLSAVLGGGEEGPPYRRLPAHNVRAFRDDAMSNGWSHRNAYRRGYGDSYWDGGIMKGYSREGDHSMYTNWYTDTAVSSNNDAGYISLGDGTFCSWD